MSEEIKDEKNLVDNINQDFKGKDNNQEVSFQSKSENEVNHDVIHKKEGRLHIYIRQDKYKGELKSKNWVGRAYISGKQTIYSSRTTVLEEAVPILEKWFDEITEKKNEIKKNENDLEEKKLQPLDTTVEAKQDSKNLENQLILEKNENKGLNSSMFEKFKDIKLGNFLKSKKSSSENENTSGMMDKLKNIKVENIFKSKNVNENQNSSGMMDKLKNIKVENIFKPNNKNDSKKNKKNSLSSLKDLFKSKVSKASVAGEEVAGLDITREAIRVSQVSGDKENGFILEKYSYRLLDQDRLSENILESSDYLSEEIQLAFANAKITATNVAISIPVSSAIIRVVSSPLITETELEKAIETDSLWENLVQLGENLNEYSIFHQVINRDEKKQTMEILFVASKLADINNYSSLIKKCGLNPVIVDVRCFTLKNSFDNTIFQNISERNDSTILEIGVDENYLMIIHNDTPVITDIFLRQPEKELLNSLSQTSESNAEAQAVIRRYAMQLKQALSDYEGKYDNKINNIQVISTLPNIENVIPEFKKNLPTIGFKLFDPLEGVKIPEYNSEKIDLKNKSTLASVLGLAYRKLDIFGYYKFVTAVKNINLLPNRDSLKQTAKLKFLSGFAIKGLSIAIAAIYIVLSVTAYFQIQSNKEKLVNFDSVQTEHTNLNIKYEKVSNELMKMETALALGDIVSSNQISTYRALAQVARSVPARVQFTKMIFDGDAEIIISGRAFSDQDILNFINNLNAKKLIQQASLVTMNVENDQEGENNTNKKGFEINCKLLIES
tara:strand:+ start:176 stop:2527 length:2352 start_codon:yes stop_codon:yes gene_type:complete